jgi:hypothetical protein
VKIVNAHMTVTFAAPTASGGWAGAPSASEIRSESHVYTTMILPMG